MYNLQVNKKMAASLGGLGHTTMSRSKEEPKIPEPIRDKKGNLEVICQRWHEMDEGVQRLDGYTLHLSRQDCRKYVNDYRKENYTEPETPPFYIATSGEPREIFVSQTVYDKILESRLKGHYGINVPNIEEETKCTVLGIDDK